MPRSLVLVMAVATGISAASLYYAQPLLPVIERSLHIRPGVAGLIVTLTQIGYAAGLLFVIPLGDILERRRLVAVLSVGLAASLLVVGLAPDGTLLMVMSVVVGLTAVLAQVLVPFAAGLAADRDRGRVVGTVMSGLLIGILLARTVAGLVAQAGGWRAIYLVAAGVVVVQAVVLDRVLPRSRERTALGYAGLLRSVAHLARTEPTLRRRAALGGLNFMAFSVLWTSIAFLLAGPPYRYGPAVIGLFGLVGAGGALAATLAGRLSDRGHTRRLTTTVAALLLLSWLPIWFGRRDVAALIVGILVLDLAVQGMQVTNQSVIYRIAPDARARVNSVYMTTYFVGGAIGSAVSAAAYDGFGWAGVVVAGAAASALCLVLVVATHDRAVSSAARAEDPPVESGQSADAVAAAS